jgi:4-amino-4-deoxy-L-arabinose transferase-like glycosyltransferase
MHDVVRVWIPGGIRNYEWYGWKTLGLTVTRNTAPVENLSQLEYYSHHPGLLIWLPAFATQYLGLSELSIRFVFATATMISAASFYIIARRLTGATIAILALLFYIITPFINYFGRIPGHDPPGFMAAMLFGAVLINWHRHPTGKRFLALCFLVWLAVWTAWPAIFFVAFLALIPFVMGNNRQRIAILALGFVTIISFVLLMGLYELQQPGSFTSLMNSFFVRVSSSSSHETEARAFTLSNWIRVNSAHTIFYVSVGTIILALMGIPILWRRLFRTQAFFWIGLLLAGIAYQIVFRNAAYIHDYYKAFLMPALAISAAVMWYYGRQMKTRFTRPLVDGLAIAAIVQCLAVLFLLKSTAYQPVFDEMIRYINDHAAKDQPIVVWHQDYEAPTQYFVGWKHVIEYYTLHHVQWDISPEEALAEQDKPLYIRCEANLLNNIPPALQDYDYDLISGGICLAFDLNQAE